MWLRRKPPEPRVSSLALAAFAVLLSIAVSSPDAAFSFGSPSDAAAAAAGAGEDWLGRVMADLRAREYEPSRARGVLSAPNRAQNLRARFGDTGIEMVPRVSSGGASDWCWQWETSAWGRLGTVREAPAVAPASHGLRVEYVRSGWTEWYENGPEGLEQGFTIARRPAGEGPLFLEGRIVTDLLPESSGEGTAIDFLDERGVRVFRYGELHARDAAGRELAAHLDGAPGILRLVVDDASALYPVEIDPLMTSPAWTASGSQLSAQFGYSVATAGDVNGDRYSDVIVGAPTCYVGDEDWGRAYVYLGSASGLSATPAWQAEGDQAYAEFGSSVATAGDVNGDGYDDVVIGEPRYYDTLAPEQPVVGRAFLYLGSASGLGASPAWRMDGYVDGGEFGISLATAGDVNGDGYDDVVVGEPGYYDPLDPEGSCTGRAHLYVGSASGLGISPAWQYLGTIDDEEFGLSVATAGDVNGDGYDDVIVGAPCSSHYFAPGGRAYVFHGSSSGLETTPAWTMVETLATAQFGRSVASAGDVNGDGYADVLVGDPKYDDLLEDDGRAYLYLGSASGLATSPAWYVRGDQNWGSRGDCVATAGDVNGDGYADILVGEYEWDFGGGWDYGRAFLYLGSASGPDTNYVWHVEGSQHLGRLGYVVATAGDVNGDGYSDVLVSEPGWDSPDSTDLGRAFLYLGSGDGLAANAGWASRGFQDGAYFGWSVASAGDVNGDGYGDVIVGASEYDNGQTDEGRAFVFLGSNDGLYTSPAWTAESDQAYARFGSSVASAGDVNGDGYGDVIVGCPYYNGGQSEEGRAYVYLGDPSETLSPTPSWTAESDQAGAWFGCSVASAGDVNRDGYGDVIVGAWGWDGGYADEGRAHVFHGSASGLAATAAWTAEGDQAGAGFGRSVASAGDVNLDSCSDVIVGAPFWDGGGLTDQGAAYIYYGSFSGLSPTPAWGVNSNRAYACLGGSVAGAGDVDGNIWSDVIIGAAGYSDGQPNEGLALLYLSGPSGPGTSPAWMVEGNQANAYLGHSVSPAGDVNGDGLCDVIVGAPGYSNGETEEGRAFVYLGERSMSGLGTTPAWTAESDQAYAWLGVSVSTAGDVDGDGFSDVIAGAWGYDLGHLNEGRASVFLGNAGGGLDRIPRQAEAYGTAPIALLGWSDSGYSFRLKARGRTPAGRGRVHLEWEVKPAGNAFTGTGLGQGSVQQTGVPGGMGSFVGLNDLVYGLSSGCGYHWRLRIVSDSPFFPRTPWFSPQGNGPGEMDLVMAGPTPAAVSEEPVGTTAQGLVEVSPNPFAPRTTVTYSLAQATHVRLSIFDAQGRRVAVLVDEVQTAGPHEISWDGRTDSGALAGAGVYFARFEAEGKTESQKLVLTR